jgi:hypothetical protein
MVEYETIEGLETDNEKYQLKTNLQSSRGQQLPDVQYGTAKNQKNTMYIL